MFDIRNLSTYKDFFLAKQITTVKKELGFDAHAFLSTTGKGRDMLSFHGKNIVYAQGDVADGLFFIQKGKVLLTVISEDGKEAVLGILGQGDFFGESGLAGQIRRISSATAMTDCILLHVEDRAMLLAMSLEPTLSAMFLQSVLKRNIRYQEDLVDQLFNSSEKRLARLLLSMAHFGGVGLSETLIPRLSQKTLAEIVGTTRSRVSFFMNRFENLGFIHYDVGDEVRVRSSLLNVVLRDDNETTATVEAKNPIASANKRLERPQRPDCRPTMSVLGGHL
jgi:CRP/FNR family transcriptional regulator, cyclic AMP receptor protein